VAWQWEGRGAWGVPCGDVLLRHDLHTAGTDPTSCTHTATDAAGAHATGTNATPHACTPHSSAVARLSVQQHRTRRQIAVWWREHHQRASMQGSLRRRSLLLVSRPNHQYMVLQPAIIDSTTVSLQYMVLQSARKPARTCSHRRITAGLEDLKANSEDVWFPSGFAEGSSGLWYVPGGQELRRFKIQCGRGV
jgi:hypothetical protein